MNDQSDQQLLSDYAERQSEAAFAAIVHRYVDLIHSAALRMVCDSQLAQDVTQNVFVALAKHADQLADRPTLAGWLHGTTQNIAAQTVRTDVRRRAREQEAAVMNEILSVNTDTDWEHIAPYLDDALGALSEPDRDAVLLRYFKNHDLRTVGATLGISDDAAQKRVSRAVERLREFFAKRGVTVGTSGLAVVISANAVQAAPVGLALTISTAAALTGTTLTTTATVTATKTIAMTALQKTIVTATVAVLAGAGIYEARQASQLREQVQTLQQQLLPLTEENRGLQSRLASATNQINGLRNDNERLDHNTTELLRLRGEVARLRGDSQELKAAAVQKANDPMKPEVEFILARMSQLKRGLEQAAGRNIPETQLLSDENWLHLSQSTRNINLETEAGMSEGLAYVRELAKQFGVSLIQHALTGYTKANGGELPTDVLQLKPYLQYQVDDSIRGQYATTKDQTDDAILQRYQMTKTGNVSHLQPRDTVMAEKAIVDEQLDTLWKIGINYASWEGTGANKGRTGTINSAVP